MSNLTCLQGSNTKAKFMSRILEKFMLDPKQDPDPEPYPHLDTDTDPKPTEKEDPDPKKFIPDPQPCPPSRLEIIHPDAA